MAAGDKIMKLYGGMLTVLFVLLVFLTAVLISSRRPWRVKCTRSEMVVRGFHGEEVDCLCLRGVIATCVNPEPMDTKRRTPGLK